MRSWFATATSLRFLLLALAVSDTSATYCEFSTSYWGGTVSNQQELDTKYAGCTEIDGTVLIAANYTGGFYLPNVTFIRYGIYTVTSYPRDDNERPIPVPLLTSVEVPDLNNTNTIDIAGGPALTTISFPSLTVLNSSLNIDGVEDCFVDFPSLTSTYYLMIIGNVTRHVLFHTQQPECTVSNPVLFRLNFPLLANGGTMRISRKPASDDDWYDYLTVDRVDQLPLDINFPVLQNASSVYLQGNISSLSMPRLSRIADERRLREGRLRILTHGNPLNISLPSLSLLRDISAAGTIGNLSFPSLLNIQRFEVNTSTPLKVALEPIQTINDILIILGNFTAVSMSTVTKIVTTHILSDSGDFHCSSITSELMRINTGRYPTVSECRGAPPKSKLPLKLGLGLGLGIPVFLVVAYLLRLCCLDLWGSEMWTPQPEVKPPEYELGVPPTYATEGPPTYDASEGGRESEQGSANVVGARTGDGSSVRGEDASEHSAGDAASARPGDGNSALQEGASGRRVV
ncbi:hypothetical protein V499_01496 [Pseudogymnoascus sp. VKM F-103]|nr:hypothetical protein V499_01496 [Pseudogymnoascus sp. VKM F-103]